MKTALVLILLLLPGVASADINFDDLAGRLHGLDPTDAAASSIADGIDLLMIRTADSLIGFAAGNQTNEIGGLTGQIIKYASWSINPFEYASIQKMMGVTLCVSIGVLVTYCLIGAIYCNIDRWSSKHKTARHVLDGGSTSHELQDYAGNVIFGCIATSLMPLVIYLSLLVAHGLKETAMLSVVEMIAPGKSIPLLYLAMSIMWMILSIFFGIANIVILATGAGSFLIGALYASEKTRHVSTGWFDYFVSVVFMQVIIVSGVVLVVTVMTEIADANPLLWATTPVDVSMYLGIIIAATWLAYRMTLGKTRVLRSTSHLIAKVV